MKGLRSKKYLSSPKKRFDPFALGLGLVGLFAVSIGAGGLKIREYLSDWHSILIVFGGSFASLLFQYDFSALAMTFRYVVTSFMGTPDRQIQRMMRQLDQAILGDSKLYDLREGHELTGELLSDVVFMHKQGLLFDEIDAFITARIEDEFLQRQIAANLLARGAVIAPSMGLFGTVIGLISVLKSLANPQEIGPAMSLALMTTAYGALLGSLIFTPLSGRMEHHNHIFLEAHKQLLAKIGILLTRDERRLEASPSPEGLAA